MFNFDFYNPTKILFGKGKIADLANEVPQQARILMVYGGGSIKQNGVYEQVKLALQKHHVSEFSGVEPNPSYETLMRAVAQVRQEKIDFILAVGGGSVIDGCKFIAAAALYQGEDPWEILQQHGRNVSAALPFGAVLTLPATGSEMNSGSVVSRLSIKAKMAFASPHCFPKFSVLDPETTLTLPVRQVGNGVVDAFVHVMEQYLTYPVNSPLQDRLAEAVLATLIEEGPKALRDPNNYEVRANIMWCATMALNGVISTGVPQDWATHMIGHELTALYGLDHAQTLAIVLPAMMQARRADKHEKLLQYGARIWGIKEGDEASRVTAAIQKTREFFESMQVKTRLSGYGLDQHVVEPVLAALAEHRMTSLGERRNVGLEKSREVLELSL